MYCCASEKKMPTALEQHAASLRTRRHSLDEAPSFPMYVLPVGTFLALTAMRDHDDLLRSGALVEFKHHLGNAVFVSHQWTSVEHPDPTFEQASVLQEAIRNLLSGRSKASLQPNTELICGREAQKYVSPEALNKKTLYLWYDFFCCPQSKGDARLRDAIDSIPAYIVRCQFFFILCPVLEHAQDKEILRMSTWQTRGWCLAEAAVWELASDIKFMLRIESAHHQTLTAQLAMLLSPPGLGDFSIESDRARIGDVLQEIIRRKLVSCLQRKDWHGYRYLLNQQTVRLRGLPTQAVPGFLAPLPEGKCASAAESLVANFLHQNGFCHLHDRDSAGWSPICYAAVGGNPTLIQALLEQRANANDSIKKMKRDAQFPKGLHVLQICAMSVHNTAMKLLIEARANVHAKSAQASTTSLTAASVADNVVGIRVLCDAGARVLDKDGLGFDALRVAATAGRVNAAREILARSPSPD